MLAFPRLKKLRIALEAVPYKHLVEVLKRSRESICWEGCSLADFLLKDG